jgi:hypothetical protein
MTILPPRTLTEFFLFNPLGAFVTIITLLILVLSFLTIYQNWKDMKVVVDISKICIGGACP